MVDKITSWKYAEDFVDESDAMLRARARAEELGIECITAATGAHLALVVSALGAKAIVEAGTGSGLSGLWLLSGNKQAVLATIDSEGDHLTAAKASFKDGKIAATRTRVIHGRAAEVMSNMADAAYDLVFLDADRETLEEQIREASRLSTPRRHHRCGPRTLARPGSRPCHSRRNHQHLSRRHAVLREQ